jgi:hypothetical protein
VSTVKKSQARSWSRCCARKARQVLPQDPLDGCLGDAVAHLQEFALELAVAPGAVLAGEAQDQVDGGGRDRRSAAFRGVAERPLPPHDLAMPAEHGVGPHEHDRAGQGAVAGNDRRQEDRIPAREAGYPRRLALIHAHLLAQDDDLDSEVSPIARRGMQQVEDQREGGEEEGEGHRVPFR